MRKSLTSILAAGSAAAAVSVATFAVPPHADAVRYTMGPQVTTLSDAVADVQTTRKAAANSKHGKAARRVDIRHVTVDARRAGPVRVTVKVANLHKTARKTQGITLHGTHNGQKFTVFAWNNSPHGTLVATKNGRRTQTRVTIQRNFRANTVTAVIPRVKLTSRYGKVAVAAVTRAAVPGTRGTVIIGTDRTGRTAQVNLPPRTHAFR